MQHALGRYALGADIVFDGEYMHHRRYVLVDGTEITGICEESALPSDYQRRWFANCAILPGLIDAHVHLLWDGSFANPQAIAGREDLPLRTLRAARHAGQALSRGVTTVRDVGCPDRMSQALRDAARLGFITSPTIVSAGAPIVMTGGHVHYIARQADGPDEVRKAVREQVAAGADLIKVMASGNVYLASAQAAAELTIEELRAAVEEAHRLGRPVSAHAIGQQAIANAIVAGVDSIEHGAYLTAEQAVALADRRIALTPTVCYWERISTAEETPAFPGFNRARATAAFEASVEAVKRALAAEVTIVAGTDSGAPLVPHGSLPDEVVTLTRCGLSPAQALKSATVDAARLLGLSELVGSLAPRRQADLLVVAGNPFDDIAKIRQPVAIIARGGWVLVPAND